MKLRFTARAARDLTEIADYIRAESPHAAERVRASIIESLRVLSEFPKAGRRQSVKGVRKLVTRKYGYLVYYSLRERTEEVVILTIQHPARQRDFSDR
jgi:addiction module RelE/StbE family toxin